MFDTLKLYFLIVIIIQNCNGQKDPHMIDGRKAIVHLFEWKWDDIAAECERFLGPKGFGGVQTSPPNENAIFAPAPFDKNIWRPWYERYQPVSYKLETRSGNESQFRSMVDRCNKVGIRIYPDVVINHMTGQIGSSYGTGGSYYDSNQKQYPGVPFGPGDFNSCEKCGTSSCNIENFGDANQVRNCRLLGLLDLDHSKQYVRDKIIEFLNHLISIGVAGFRVDASKHMDPSDLVHIYNSLNNLNETYFLPGSRPFIYQEVIDLGNEPITAAQYIHLGRVTEFRYGLKLSNVLRRHDGMKWMSNFGEGWGFIKSENAVVFVDNHDSQRGHGSGGVFTFKQSRQYKIAIAFLLAWSYGVPRVMSSFAFDLDWTGPPHDGNYNTLTVRINPDITCADGWICEHRWRQIYNMVGFAKTVGDSEVKNWWSMRDHQIAFSRGDRGFIAINNDDQSLTGLIQTGLKPGRYCDVISGSFADGKCTGRIVTVNWDGKVYVDIDNNWEDPMIALHVDAKL